MTTLSVALLLLIGRPSVQVPATDPALSVREARVQPIAPRPAPPAWMDFERVQRGYGLMRVHGAAIVRTLGTSSLAATFAARDVAPVLMQTGRLPHDFVARMKGTEARMATVLFPAKDRDGFLKRVYASAVSLGELHVDLAEEFSQGLAWDPKTRLPMNAQAFAFVLYTFAYWPVEALVAQGALDPAKQAAELDDWFHLWSVLGYGMGVPERLLPHDFSTARRIASLLRAAQYESTPEGVPLLLGNHVRMIAERSKTDVAAAAKGLADSIALSPGEAAALGLGADPAARLAEYGAKSP